MSALRWIHISLFLMLLYATAGTGKFSAFTVREGADVTLPCQDLVYDTSSCDTASWFFSSYITELSVVLVRNGLIVSGPTSGRLALTRTCSLVIKKVTVEDGGIYTCRQHSRTDVRLVVKTGEAATTTRSTTTTTTTTMPPTTAAPRTSPPPPPPPPPPSTTTTTTTTATATQEARTDCSVVNYIMLVMRVAELVLITVITVLLIRARGRQRPPDDNTVLNSGGSRTVRRSGAAASQHHDGGGHGGTVTYENIGDPSTSV
ncbi:uncharacterized protein LOC121621980 isoform X2 [Chelmon rostratus]|uniref:uncharacterized protein LOC121621980 isoform X2 n=1 Tax=Chelmon rostratus TaxID=109905 RepID=UPI001BE9B95F|nr:uncharacterized protein LOC121621980 isoform X2 [Chelmon rostratus]